MRDTMISIRPTYLLLLCASVVLFSLAAPWTVSWGGWLVSGASPFSGEGELADWTETGEQEDSLMPAQIGSARLHCVASLCSASGQAKWIWTPAPPVRPPISSR